jgi:mono/diheme cytochrome c family protein
MGGSASPEAAPIGSVCSDLLVLGERNRALDQVLELARVAAQRVGEDALDGVGRETVRSALVVLAEEGLGERGDVVGALAKRREVDRDHREPEVEVLAKAPLGDLAAQVLVRGRHDADVDSDRLVPADGPNLAVLQHAEQLARDGGAFRHAAGESRHTRRRTPLRTRSGRLARCLQSRTPGKRGADMKTIPIACVALAAALLSAGVAAGPAQREPNEERFRNLMLSLGEREFAQHCAVCHGLGAGGDGPAAQALRTPPADLRRIALRRAGTFPDGEIAEKIDGRLEVTAHGTREMPVWGVHLATPIAEDASGAEVARGRIDLLVEYLRAIQVDDGKR